MVFCSKCGSEIVDLTTNFCPKCGFSIKATPTQSQNTDTKLQRPTEWKSESTSRKSLYWYFLPLSLSIIGGITAYLILKNKDRKKAKLCLIIGFLIFIPVASLQIIIPSIYGTENPFYIVASGSMSPTLEIYDIVVTSGKIPFDDIQVGDIIVFNRPSDHDRVIVHRVVSIIDDNPKTIRTKGDTNPASIQGTDFPITEEEYIGKVSSVIPQFGYVTQIVKPPVNYILIIAYLGIIFGILTKLNRKYKKEVNQNQES